jgi:hypothetical protein
VIPPLELATENARLKEAIEQTIEVLEEFDRNSIELAPEKLWVWWVSDAKPHLAELKSLKGIAP